MSAAVTSPSDFYTLEVGAQGKFAVRGWNDKRILSIHETQREARAEAKRLNIEGHATAPVELPEPLIYGAATRAEVAGVSIQEWINSALEERIRDDELSERVWRRRAEGANPRTLNEILNLVRDHPPDPGDELEP